MTKWMQYTYVNGELKYGPTVRTADRMLELFAQMHFLRQAGEDIAVHCETDEDYNVTAYLVARPKKERPVSYRFVRMEEE